MRILALKPGHDGAIACLEDGVLRFSIEAEKNNFTRYCDLQAHTSMYAFQRLDGPPDVVALGGWLGHDKFSAKYVGLTPDTIVTGQISMFGRKAMYFSSSHERSHILGAFAMTSWPNRTPCYALVWEGGFGSFYEIDENLSITRLAQVMAKPGERYVYPYLVAWSECRQNTAGGLAGTVMALAAFGGTGTPTRHERAFIDAILALPDDHQFDRRAYSQTPYFDIGIEAPAAKSLYRRLADAIFDRFYAFAEAHMTKQLPLLISGGCGLNCEWNSRWRDSGLFPEIFVPPCANDSGSAIGTAVDAQFRLTGDPKITWDVYAGDDFIVDCVPPDDFEEHLYSPVDVARYLAAGHVLAWVQGRYEIGPRALGHRSIIASPFDSDMRHRLNTIKCRQHFRPVAPVVLESDVSRHFEWNGASPYMLYFQNVRDQKLRAITHVDNSARVQTVTASQNSQLYQLLVEFRTQTGNGVLCNTSLNYPGRGFINQMTDLVDFVRARRLDGFVVDDRFFLRR